MKEKPAESVQRKNSIRPAFTIYHANGKGNGSAVAFRVYPATAGQSGFVQVELAMQQTVGDEDRRVYPTFDWKGRILVRLTPIEVGEMLMVLRGASKGIRNGAGFRHQTDGRISHIRFDHLVEPKDVYCLEVSQETIAGEERKVSIELTLSEANAIAAGMSSSMGKLCFGE